MRNQYKTNIVNVNSNSEIMTKEQEKLNTTMPEFKEINTKKLFIKNPLAISMDKNEKKDKKINTNILNTDLKLYKHVQIRKKFYPQPNELLSPKYNMIKNKLKTMSEKSSIRFISSHFNKTFQDINKEKDSPNMDASNERNSSNIIQVKKKINENFSANKDNVNNNSISSQLTRLSKNNNSFMYNYTKKKVIYQGKIKNKLNKNIHYDNNIISNNTGNSIDKITMTETRNNKNDDRNEVLPTYTKTESNVKVFPKNNIFNKFKIKSTFLLFPRKKEDKEILNSKTMELKDKKYRKKNNIDLINSLNINNQKTDILNNAHNENNDNSKRNNLAQSINGNEKEVNKKEKRRYIYINRRIKNDTKKTKDINKKENTKYNNKKENVFKLSDKPIEIKVENSNSERSPSTLEENYFSIKKKEEIISNTNIKTTTNMNIYKNMTNKLYYKHFKTRSSADNNKPFQTLKSLVHKAHEMEELSDCFGKCYKTGPSSARNIQYKNETLISDRAQKLNYLHYNNTKLNTLSDISNINLNNSDIISEEKKHFKKYSNLYDNIIENPNTNPSNKIINNNTYNTTVNFYKINNLPSELNKSSLKLRNSILSKMTNETQTQNKSEHRRISSDNMSYTNLIENLMANTDRKNNSKTPKESSHNASYQDINPNNEIKEEKIYKDNEIDLEMLYILEAKLKCILNKINNYNICYNECFDWINFYFSCKFYEKEINIFKYSRNRNNIIYYIKMELLCYFLCYDVSFNKNFNQAGILLKTIFNILHINFLILISYILYGIGNTDNIGEISDNLCLNKLKEVLANDLKLKLTSQDMNENNILLLISNNFKEINNYYKMIIDNLYSYYYSMNDNDNTMSKTINKFPKCLSLDVNSLNSLQKLNIISSFFFDSYRLLNNYNFDDLSNFFELYLYKSKENDSLMAFDDIIIVNKNNNIIDKASSPFNTNNYITNNPINYNFINNNNNNKVYANDNNKYIFNEKKFYNDMIINEFFLPPIKSYYKYTLVLDLDETLIYFQKDNNFIDYTYDNYNSNKKSTLIFRPGLLDFLRKMKPLYELVLFSFGTKEYVNHILTIIEKKEKFFEYVLYRQHATFEKGDYVKNLALLGRDLKKIIIVDNIPHVFKLQKSNGICIKSFYGDVISERNTLKILGKILETIRFDADENEGDIRKSLKKQRNLIFAHITTNFE